MTARITHDGMPRRQRRCSTYHHERGTLACACACVCVCVCVRVCVCTCMCICACVHAWQLCCFLFSSTCQHMICSPVSSSTFALPFPFFHLFSCKCVKLLSAFNVLVWRQASKACNTNSSCCLWSRLCSCGGGVCCACTHIRSRANKSACALAACIHPLPRGNHVSCCFDVVGVCVLFLRVSLTLP